MFDWQSLMSWEQSTDYQLSAGEEHLSNLTNHITDLQQQVQLLSIITVSMTTGD